MEQLIEALRKAEAEVAGNISGESQAVTKYETYTQAVKVASELPGLPAGVLGPYSWNRMLPQRQFLTFIRKALQCRKL